jgi:hypothetical protein
VGRCDKDLRGEEVTRRSAAGVSPPRCSDNTCGLAPYTTRLAARLGSLLIGLQ